MSERLIYFNEKYHTYTDDMGSRYISVTTLIGKYEYKFEDKADDIIEACVRIGQDSSHPKYSRYAGMSADDIRLKWNKQRDDSLVRGNNRHDYLEESVKVATKFPKSVARRPGGRLFTVYELLNNPRFGELDLDDFVKAGVKDRFPRIFKIVKALVDDGYKLYAEIGVFSVEYLISGLIDLFAIKGNSFVIVDWKTNKYPIQFAGGYYEKDNSGNIIGYKITNETMKPPLAHLQQSNGVKYGLQTGLYAYLVELLGLKCEAIIICQILPELYSDKDTVPVSWRGKEKVNTVVIEYRLDDIVTMVNDYLYKREGGQMSLRMSSY